MALKVQPKRTGFYTPLNVGFVAVIIWGRTATVGRQRIGMTPDERGKRSFTAGSGGDNRGHFSRPKGGLLNAPHEEIFNASCAGADDLGPCLRRWASGLKCVRSERLSGGAARKTAVLNIRQRQVLDRS